MTLFLHELKRNRISLIVWTAAISFMLGVCIIIYPDMSAQMGDISDMFSNMGAFSDAFGMDQLNFGEFMGYFGVECGNTLGLGGAFFAALLGISALSKEERDKTAEFLLSHPVTRRRVVLFKLLSILTQILILNMTVALVTIIGVLAIGAEADAGKMAWLLLSSAIMQIEISAITFGISAFIRRGGLAIGMGLAMGLYFLNIVSNLTDKLDFLKYISPFGYTDGGQIVANGLPEIKYLLPGVALTLAGAAAAFWKYERKDIA
ncbi:MAG: ABC transporter permease [Ruminococcaceae bacterium]|nr:ABC transporter permease [Oscillospiraceae bacterium]